jgi:hypothetical protein
MAGSIQSSSVMASSVCTELQQRMDLFQWAQQTIKVPLSLEIRRVGPSEYFVMFNNLLITTIQPAVLAERDSLVQLVSRDVH